MKCSAAFVALVSSIVLAPAAMSAMINKSTALKPQAIMMPKATVSESPSCAGLVEAYHTANDTQDSPRDVINKCLTGPAADEATLRLPAPRLLMISLPTVALGDVKRDQLPSLETLKQAAVAMEENVMRMSEHRADFIAMDYPSKVDFLFCNIKGTGALCGHNGRFFPASSILRAVADFVLRLFSKEVQLDRAIKAVDTINVQKVELVKAVSKSLNALIAEYPAAERGTKYIAKWLKSYRLMQGSIDAAAYALNLPLVELLPKSIVVAM
jgi:hypothetical protein